MIKVMNKQSLLTILKHGSTTLLTAAECGKITLLTVAECSSVNLLTVADCFLSSSYSGRILMKLLTNCSRMWFNHLSESGRMCNRISFIHNTICSKMLFNHSTNSSRTLYNHRTCAGRQPGAKPRTQEPVGVAFVNLTGAAQQDL